MGRTRAMDDLPGNDEALPRIEGHCPIVQIDEQLALHHVKELIVCDVFVPVVRTFDYAQAHNGFVHLAECLVIPLKLAGVRQSLGVDDFQWLVQDIQASFVGYFAASLMRKHLEAMLIAMVVACEVSRRCRHLPAPDAGKRP